MSDVTPRFALPLLQSGQAQKELFHNEAIARLEALAQPVAETLGDNAPPTSPTAGKSWIVGPSPTGGWAGQPRAFATWSDGGWRFTIPIEGMTAWVTGLGQVARYSGTAWTAGIVAGGSLRIGGIQVVGAQQSTIAAPAGGTVIDVQARSILASLLVALKAHGLIAI